MKALFQQLTKKLTGRETDTPNPEASVFFFPLRTNVEYFASPGGFLTLERRIKQAALLYDVLMFEGGMYIATVGEMRIPVKSATCPVKSATLCKGLWEWRRDGNSLAQFSIISNCLLSLVFRCAAGSGAHGIAFKLYPVGVVQ